MDDREVAKHWDANAAEWTAAVRAGYDVTRVYQNNPAFFAMLGDIRGLRVLDVGCGEGTNTRAFADLGAKMVGVDISAGMIAAAREHEAREPRGIDYHVAGAAEMDCFADASFDGVVSTMALMDVADYPGCCRDAARVLKPGGFFQCSVIHPSADTRHFRWVRDESGGKVGYLVGDYFGLGPECGELVIEEWFFGSAPAEVKAAAQKFRAPHFFRTLTDYVNALIDAGLVLERIAEPYASEEAARECP